MRWRVAISEFEGDLRLLRDVLVGLSAGLVEEDGQLFMTSTEFEALDKSGDVHGEASRLASVINEANYGELAGRLAIKVGHSVLEWKRDGTLANHTVIAVGTARIEYKTHAVAVGNVANANLPEAERKRIEAEIKERGYQRTLRITLARAKSAHQDKQAQKVQEILKGRLDTHSLWHIFEIIQDDMGGAIKNLAPQNQLERFERSMNHPEALGDMARHAVSNKKPPRNPMRLDEARQFIRNLAQRWMEHKAGLDDDKG